MNDPTRTEGARDKFLKHLAASQGIGAKLPDLTPHERCDGVVFSVLTMIDGMGSEPFPMICHVDGQRINGDIFELHAAWHKYNPE
jgi:hypothetical protein